MTHDIGMLTAYSDICWIADSFFTRILKEFLDRVTGRAFMSLYQGGPIYKNH